MTMSAQISRKMGAATILRNDPHGFTVALISIAVVLSALITLAIIIAIFSRIVMAMSKQTAAEAAPASASSDMSSGGSTASVSVDAGANGEVVAAIALAMKLYQEDLHDHESEIITINTVARAYSPWSSKFHGLTNMPR